jgi:hypothetical protein
MPYYYLSHSQSGVHGLAFLYWVYSMLTTSDKPRMEFKDRKD